MIIRQTSDYLNLFVFSNMVRLISLLILLPSFWASSQAVIDLKHVQIDLVADNLSTSVSGTTKLTFQLLQVDDFLELELVNELTVNKVLVNESEVSFQHASDLLMIDYPGAISEELQSVTITYSGEPNSTNSSTNGIFNDTSNAWGNQITWTLSEPFYAKYWWPAKQDLTDKIDSININITTSSNLKVGSNGLLKNVVELNDNQVRYEWESNYPIAYYLLSFTVGEYVEFNNYAYPNDLNGDGILIQNYIYNNPETLPFYQDQLEAIPEMLEIFSEYFGLYPFHEEKYGHVMAPFGGGMEHQTMSTMGIFTFGLNAHELGHQWFGNHVTCGTWNDIWINEGFARFCEYFAAEKILSLNNYYALVEDDILSVIGTPDGSTYVPVSDSDNDNRIFNFRLTYAKGGLLVNMIRHIVNNDDQFFAAIQAYLSIKGESTATADEFQSILERETSLDFSPFFQQWYYGEGHPVFDIQWQKEANDTINLEIKQHTTANTSLFTTPLEFRIKFESGLTKLFRVSQSQSEQTFKIPANGKVARLEFDPKGWLIKEVNSFYQLDENGNPILSELVQNEPLIWPNPGNGSFNLKGGLKEIQIFDLNGRLVQDIESPTEFINLDHLPPGKYLLKALDNQNPRSVKFQKE